jgi:hypothetical protein
MTQDTRTRMFPTFLILAFVGIAGYIIMINTTPVQTNGHKKEKVIVTVTFLPETMPSSGSGVDAVISLDGVPTIWQQVRRSPWVVQMDVPKGQSVTVEAEREVIMLLECFIHVNAKQVDHDSVNTGGRVKCEYGVKFWEKK